MDTIDIYVLSVMVYAICVILFKGGMIRHKWVQTKRNERIFDFVLLVPYFLAVIIGVFLIITKEVVL
jgi:hypothetical protein